MPAPELTSSHRHVRAFRRCSSVATPRHDMGVISHLNRIGGRRHSSLGYRTPIEYELLSEKNTIPA